jgi:hypothetical protein
VALKKATFCFIVKIMKYFIITFGCQMNPAPEQGSVRGKQILCDTTS